MLQCVQCESRKTEKLWLTQYWDGSENLKDTTARVKCCSLRAYPGAAFGVLLHEQGGRDAHNAGAHHHDVSHAAAVAVDSVADAVMLLLLLLFQDLLPRDLACS